MREAVIVSTARTALTKAGRGALNDTHGIKMAGHAIKGAIERAGIEGEGSRAPDEASDDGPSVRAHLGVIIPKRPFARQNVRQKDVAAPEPTNA